MLYMKHAFTKIKCIYLLYECKECIVDIFCHMLIIILLFDLRTLLINDKTNLYTKLYKRGLLLLFLSC